jgi:hypothetical protein
MIELSVFIALLVAALAAFLMGHWVVGIVLGAMAAAVFVWGGITSMGGR